MLIKGELEFVKKIGRLGINREQLLFPSVQEKLEEVEKQLICGDKYEMIYRDLLKFTNSDKTDFVLPDEYRGHRGGVLKYLLKTAYEKYFGKPREPSKSFLNGLKKGIELGLHYNELNKKIKELIDGQG